MTGPAASRPRVVVMDDDAEVREVIAECFRLEGYDVLPAANALEGLLQIKHNRPAVVTLDLHMPRVGGLEALPRIRKFDPAIRIVVVTGDLEKQTHDRAIELGAAAVVMKPMLVAELLAAVRGAAPPLTTAQARARVLIVDDDPDVRSMLEEFLRTRGYDVHVAGDAGEAITAAVKTRPDVVLLDIHLPGLEGHELLAPIRLAIPGAVVIMVSGTSDIEVARRALALGAFDFVTKPIDLAYLAQALDTALAMRALDA